MSNARRCANHELTYLEEGVVSYNIKAVMPDGKVILDNDSPPHTEDIHDTHLYCYECMEVITIDRVVDADTWEVSFE